MNRYSKPHLVIFSGAFMGLGRIALALCLLLFFVFFARYMMGGARTISMDTPLGLMWFALFAGWMVLAIISVVIALFVSCDLCHKRALFFWGTDSTQQNGTTNYLNRICAFFYPSELYKKSFTCVHCHTTFALK